MLNKPSTHLSSRPTFPFVSSSRNQNKQAQLRRTITETGENAPDVPEELPYDYNLTVTRNNELKRAHRAFLKTLFTPFLETHLTGPARKNFKEYASKFGVAVQYRNVTVPEKLNKKGKVAKKAHVIVTTQVRITKNNFRRYMEYVSEEQATKDAKKEPEPVAGKRKR